MDREQELKLKKEIVVGMIELWCGLLEKIDKELKRERMKKLLKQIEERMYESNEK